MKLGISARWRESERILPHLMRLYQEFQNELDRPIDRPRMTGGIHELWAERHGHAAGESDWCGT